MRTTAVLFLSQAAAVSALTIGAAVRTPAVIRTASLQMQAPAPAMVDVRDGHRFFLLPSAVVLPCSLLSVARGVQPPQKALESITLKNAAGDSATVYKFGACVTSYVKGGVDYLMVRPDAKMDGSKPISGGIPHCFPQFGPGAIQQHGFARNLDWDVVEQTSEKVVFGLSESEYTLAMWPNKFSATYTVTLAADELKTELTVMNTDAKTWDFTAALHTYWSVDGGIGSVKVTSPAFAGATYLDKTASPPADAKSASDVVTIAKETDSVYAGVSGAVVLSDAKRSVTIDNTVGWSDTVIWNPCAARTPRDRRPPARTRYSPPRTRRLIDMCGLLSQLRRRGHGLRYLRVRRVGTGCEQRRARPRRVLDGWHEREAMNVKTKWVACTGRRRTRWNARLCSGADEE